MRGNVIVMTIGTAGECVYPEDAVDLGIGADVAIGQVVGQRKFVKLVIGVSHTISLKPGICTLSKKEIITYLSITGEAEVVRADALTGRTDGRGESSSRRKSEKSEAESHLCNSQEPMSFSTKGSKIFK